MMMVSNMQPESFRSSSGNVAVVNPFYWCPQRRLENDMKKASLILASLATIAVAAPTVASAESFGFRIGGDRDYYGDRYDRGPRVGFYNHDRGWHRGWGHQDRVIIRRHHHWDD